MAPTPENAPCWQVPPRPREIFKVPSWAPVNLLGKHHKNIWARAIKDGNQVFKKKSQLQPCTRQCL